MLTVDAVITLLRQNHLFAGVSDDVLHDATRSCTVVRRPVRAQLFIQGYVANSVFLLHEGQVKLTRVTESGRTLMISSLGAGDIVGAEAVFGCAERAANATVVQESLMCRLRAADVRSLVRRYPLVAVNLAKIFYEQRERAIAGMENLAYSSVRERILRLFKSMADDRSWSNNDGAPVSAPLTHLDIATMIGSTRETVSLEMKRLTREGHLIRRDRTYVSAFAGASMAIESDPRRLALFSA